MTNPRIFIFFSIMRESQCLIYPPYLKSEIAPRAHYRNECEPLPWRPLLGECLKRLATLSLVRHGESRGNGESQAMALLEQTKETLRNRTPALPSSICLTGECALGIERESSRHGRTTAIWDDWALFSSLYFLVQISFSEWVRATALAYSQLIFGWEEKKSWHKFKIVA